jgi:hypothetical protein
MLFTRWQEKKKRDRALFVVLAVWLKFWYDPYRSMVVVLEFFRAHGRFSRYKP